MISKKTLTGNQIAELVKYSANTKRVMRTDPAFSKQQTLQILNAVSDRLGITDDGAFKIRYSTRDGKEMFFVSPARGGFAPSGNFEVKSAIARLAL